MTNNCCFLSSFPLLSFNTEATVILLEASVGSLEIICQMIAKLKEHHLKDVILFNQVFT